MNSESDILACNSVMGKMELMQLASFDVWKMRASLSGARRGT